MRVVTCSCSYQSAMISRPWKSTAQLFIPPATTWATSWNCGSPAKASFIFRMLSRDMVSTWPKASSPSNIQPSAPDSNGRCVKRHCATLMQRMRRGLVAGPVPLDPRALQVVGDHRSLEAAGPGIGNCDGGPVDHCGLGQEAEVFALGGSSGGARSTRHSP